MSRTWKITVDEGELKALIRYHTARIEDYDVARSSRIHDLIKRLNKKDEPEIEVEKTETKTETVPQAWS